VVISIFVDKNWRNEVKNIANELDKEIKKQDFAQAKEYILKLIELTKSGDVEIKRDASIAIDFILSKYGSTNPSDFLLPDWRGDFKAIKKRVITSQRTNNMTELMQIIKRMNTVISTNNDKDQRLNAIQMLMEIAQIEKRYVDEYEQHYIEAFVKETDKNVQKQLNLLLRALDETYPEDFEQTLKQLSKVEKVVKINTKFNFENDFIRYKISITNNTDDILWDVRFLIIKYEQNFALREIKPDIYAIFQDYMVMISVIKPGDTKEIFAKIEPKSSEVYLDGRLYYKKRDDREFTTIEAPNIVVNILDSLTVLEKLNEQVSIINCREFIDFHVKFKRMNAFALPKSIVPEMAYNIGKRVLTDLGFTLIMDIINEGNFYGEGLFYGRTQSKPEENTKSEEIVIILRASHENYAMEINIGCNNNAFLVAIQIKFDMMIRQIITTMKEFGEGDKLIELRCPSCFQPFDRLDRDWCPWCGADIDKNKLLS
jgi:hypothetical protein